MNDTRWIKSSWKDRVFEWMDVMKIHPRKTQLVCKRLLTSSLQPKNLNERLVVIDVY